MDKIGLFMDVETSGPDPRLNFPIQISFVIGDLTTYKILDTFNIFMPYSITKKLEWDQDALEFWHSLRMHKVYMNSIQEMRKQNLTLEEISNQMYKWLESKFEMYPKLVLFSDNPSFDIPWINRVLPVGKCIQKLKGIYKDVLDVKSWCSGIAGKHPSDIIRGTEFVFAAQALETIRGFNDPFCFYMNRNAHTHDALEDSTDLYKTTLILLDRHDKYFRLHQPCFAYDSMMMELSTMTSI